MIYIIYGPPGAGKTAFMVHLLNEYAFNREYNQKMRKEIYKLNSSGFKLTIPPHCVSANIPITFYKFRNSPRQNRLINPYRLGFKNDRVQVHFNFPFEVIGIDEGQKYLNSRMALYYPDWQSRWYEQHRHNDLKIFITTQRPMLIDPNIRDLASFIEIIQLKELKRFNKLKGYEWTIRTIKNSNLFDKYTSSGGLDKQYYKEIKIKIDYDVFELYDSQNCKPKFYDGHLKEDFDYKTANNKLETIKDYIKYLEENDDELPKNFYVKRSSAIGL